ncbi:MAG TPA: ABC transporter permease [Gemmatimonadaceae bacterium]|nr:ABC transporter permease [Gemmatimonadaceae bacterium]
MTWKARLHRLRMFLRRDPDADLSDELRFHIDMEAAALERGGMPADRARDEARRRLGGFDRYTEELRDVRGGRSLDALRQDARYALRVARRFPAFTLIVVATLAIAIGACTAIFSVINSVLLQSLPFPHPEQIVTLNAQNPDRSNPRFAVSYADYLDWRRSTRSFSDMGVFTGTAPTLLGTDEPERLAGIAVSPSFFDMLGVRAAKGRLFGPEDAIGETSESVVLTDGFWRRRFAADPNIVGQRLPFNGRARVVIGVLPPSFALDGRPIDVATVFAPSSIANVENHGQHTLIALGRLKAGVTLAQAQQDLQAVAARLADTYPDIRGWSANVFRFSDELTRTVKGPLLVLMAAAGLVLLIGCINVANLLITRAAARGREVALRQALGASRWRLVSQLLVESTLLALIGGVLGIAVASLGTRLLLRLAPAGQLPTSIPIDARVLGFALAASLATSLIVGIAPALRGTRTWLSQTLRDGGRTSAGSAHAPRLRRVLVVAEMSLALVLLVCSTLVMQSLRRMLSIDPGFQASQVFTMRVAPSPRFIDTTLVAFYRQAVERIAARPGIQSVAAANSPPLRSSMRIPMRLIGRPAPTEAILSSAIAITPGYFRTMNMRLLRGHDVEWNSPAPTLVVSQTAAKQFWGTDDPIGKHIAFGQRDTVGLEVVGLVADARTRGLVADPEAVIYMSYVAALSVARSLTFVVRGTGDMASIVAAAKAGLREVDRNTPLFNIQSVTAIVDASVAQPRLNSFLLGVFAAIALLLASLGIYGVVSYSVAQRTQEIGVRMALGARSADVFGLILREGAALALVGAIVGIAGASMATKLIQSWLYGIDRGDLTTFVLTSAGLIVVSLAASYVPARRAASVDPLLAMRGE